MEERNVTIAGSGKIEGGSYGRIKIAGAATVNGDVEAEEFRVAGSAKVKGVLRAGRLEVAGALKAEGDLEADEGEVSGSLTAEGLVQAKELRISGAARCKSIRGGFLRVSGALKADGDVEGDTVRLAGGFKVDGLIAADHLEIRLGGPCRAGELGGEHIEVRRGDSTSRLWASLSRLFGAQPGGLLEVKTIEGDEVDLEWVKAEVVRGRTVRLGPGCQIDHVEYSESLEVDPTARVGEEVKL